MERARKGYRKRQEGCVGEAGEKIKRSNKFISQDQEAVRKWKNQRRTERRREWGG